MALFDSAQVSANIPRSTAQSLLVFVTAYLPITVCEPCMCFQHLRYSMTGDYEKKNFEWKETDALQ